MILLVVNYHYVAARPPQSPRGIFPVSVDELRAQLELLGRSVEFVSRDQLVAAVRDGGPLPERSCLVTFDDGLRCQFELALPVLESLGHPALFFVPGRPLAERRALHVHKVHHVLERLPGEELLHRLQPRLNDLGVSLDPAAEEEAVRHYAYDRPDEARIKYLLNVVVPSPAREELLAGVFTSICADEGAFCDELYLSAEQVAVLERHHGAVGAHSYAHEPLALLDRRELRRDLARCAATLAATTGRRPEAISYPHGSLQAVDQDVADEAAAAGFVAGFTMERAFNRSLQQPLLLARVDANDAPGGRHALFELRRGEPAVRPGMTSARRRYLLETAGIASSP
jgi:peptidoglycan/xylan/chitin deacetylase (PgdA/CDA1 family)